VSTLESCSEVRVWRRAFRLFSANPLLRDELMIKPRYLYFVAIVEDFILRCVCVCRRAQCDRSKIGSSMDGPIERQNGQADMRSAVPGVRAGSREWGCPGKESEQAVGSGVAPRIAALQVRMFCYGIACGSALRGVAWRGLCRQRAPGRFFWTFSLLPASINPFFSVNRCVRQPAPLLRRDVAAHATVRHAT
jgi:hypothetical protein